MNRPIRSVEQRTRSRRAQFTRCPHGNSLLVSLRAFHKRFLHISRVHPTLYVTHQSIISKKKKPMLITCLEDKQQVSKYWFLDRIFSPSHNDLSLNDIYCREYNTDEWLLLQRVCPRERDADGCLIQVNQNTSCSVLSHL